MLVMVMVRSIAGCGEHLLEEHKLKASEENKEKPGEGYGHLFSSS